MLRLKHTCDTSEIVRWDKVYLMPASPVGELAFAQYQSLVDRAEPVPAVMVDDGDVLLIDNWRMLHARPWCARYIGEERPF